MFGPRKIRSLTDERIAGNQSQNPLPMYEPIQTNPRRIDETNQSKSVEKLQKDFKNLLNGGKYSDVVLKVGEREFKAHRSILSARSDYFSTMFDQDTSGNKTGIVTIENSDPSVFQDLLQYIYTGDTGDTLESIASLYIVADRYKVLELKEECVKRIKSNLSVDTFCDVARISLRHPELSLNTTIRQYFKKYASDIVSTPTWKAFMEENPKACNELFYATLKKPPNYGL